MHDANRLEEGRERGEGTENPANSSPLASRGPDLGAVIVSLKATLITSNR